MKHDLQAFSQDIVALIKTSGDSGGSGDKLKKSLRERDNFVPTRLQLVSPLKNEWGQPCAASGDRKYQRLESLMRRVPTVPTVPTHFRQGPSEPAASAVPPEWYAILAGLERQECPDWITIDRWRELLSDGDTFLSRWGSAAHSMGWTALDLFGVHPAAPAARFDVMGLLLLTRGGPVVALMADGASIRRPSGALLTWRRCPSPGGVLLSELRL